jgi:hypothetical protein
MLRASQVIFLGSAVLIAAIGGDRAVAANACVDLSSPPVGNMDSSRTATAEQPAQVSPKDGPTSLSRSPALRLTLRPTVADPASPFLAEVFAKNVCGTNASGPGQLLGVVSFFPLRVGQSQEFVLAAPEQGFPSVAPQDVQLTVKLVPANPAGSLTDTSVEVVSAQFAR